MRGGLLALSSDIPSVTGKDPVTGEEVLCRPEISAPTSALVFKISTDPYMGRLAYFRVYSGAVRRSEPILNVNRGQRERVGRLVRMYADRREEVDEIAAGDIGAVLGLKATTGDTLSGEDHPFCSSA